MKKVALITGGSKGLGKALVDAFLEQEFFVFSIARTVKQNVQSNVKQFRYDLADTENISSLMDELFSAIDLSSLEEMVLINNAGIVDPIANIQHVESNTVSAAYNLNIVAPAVLSSIFIKKLESYSFRKSILNISSGAAVNPIAGWAVYCSTKAALDMLTKTIALEQEKMENTVRTIAIYPGIVDTDMQSTIRSSKKENFPDVERFIKFKEEGDLLSAAESAQKIIDLWLDPEVANGTVMRIK